MRPCAVLFVLLLIVCGTARAQADAPRAEAPATPAAGETVRLTVDEAVARAIAASPRLARLSAQETAAEAQRQGARAERWPQVDVSAGYQYRSDVPELAIFAPTSDPAKPIERIVVFPNINNNWRTRAGVALPLYTGGRVGGQIEAAEHGRTAAQEDLRAGRADLVLETKSAYWQLVTSRESLRVLEQSMKAYDAHQKDAENRARFGMAARNEVLAVQVERDRAELDALRARAAAEVAEATPAEVAEAELAASPIEDPELRELVSREVRASLARARSDQRI